MSAPSIPGYNLGSKEVPRSPVTLQDLDRMKQTLTFTEKDVRYLQMSKEVLADQVEQILDVWYGFIGSLPFLLHYFERPSDGQPDTHYMEAVRRRFGRWILDTAEANYDQAWLDYQHQIGLRHTHDLKNKTDNAEAPNHIHYRYLPTLIYPVVATLKPFLEKKGHKQEDVVKMHQAWMKSVILQVTLWSHPYIKEGEF
jgi:hypothetical protein